jgi:hypothetical protein
MARPTQALIDALMQTAARLRNGDIYLWSHMGACNCGHLAQTVTNISRAELHAIALERAGDWSEQVVEFCPSSGLPIDHVIATMLDLGLSREDLAHLERLTSPYVLAKLPERRYLDHTRRDDVVLYLETWARALADELWPALAVVRGHAASFVSADTGVAGKGAAADTTVADVSAADTPASSEEAGAASPAASVAAGARVAA